MPSVGLLSDVSAFPLTATRNIRRWRDIQGPKREALKQMGGSSETAVPQTIDGKPPDERNPDAVPDIADNDCKKNERQATGVRLEPQVSGRYHHRRQRDQLIHAAAFERDRESVRRQDDVCRLSQHGHADEVGAG